MFDRFRRDKLRHSRPSFLKLTQKHKKIQKAVQKARQIWKRVRTYAAQAIAIHAYRRVIPSTMAPDLQRVAQLLEAGLDPSKLKQGKQKSCLLALPR